MSEIKRPRTDSHTLRGVVESWYRRKDEGGNRKPHSPPRKAPTPETSSENNLRPTVSLPRKEVTPVNGAGVNHGINDDITEAITETAENPGNKTMGIKRADPTELLFPRKENPSIECMNGNDFTGMEVTYNELYNPVNQAANLYSVQVDYVVPSQNLPNIEPIILSNQAREEAREFLKTEGLSHNGNKGTWKKIVRKYNSPKPTNLQSPTKSGSKRGQPEKDGKTEKVEREKSKTVDGGRTEIIQTAEAEVQLCRA